MKKVRFKILGNDAEVENKKLYEILGVDQKSDVATIKKAYKKLAMKHHPDKGGDPDKVLFIYFSLWLVQINLWGARNSFKRRKKSFVW